MAFNLDDYQPVDERIALFWVKYPEGRIDTDLVFNDGKCFIIKATAYRNDGTIIATDYAQEIIATHGVNANFALENGCTSAIGRVLATAGFQAKIGKRPSREEMGKVVRMQGDTQITEPSNLASDKQQNMIRAVCKSMGKVPPANLQAMTKREASAYIDMLKSGEQPAPQYDTPEEPF